MGVGGWGWGAGQGVDRRGKQAAENKRWGVMVMVVGDRRVKQAVENKRWTFNQLSTWRYGREGLRSGDGAGMGGGH